MNASGYMGCPRERLGVDCLSHQNNLQSVHSEKTSISIESEWGVRSETKTWGSAIMLVGEYKEALCRGDIFLANFCVTDVIPL